MTPLSPPGNPLPPLCGSALLLAPEVVDRMDADLIPRLSGGVASFYWDVVKKLDNVARDVPFASLQRADSAQARERVLDGVKALMHELAALTEYLRRALTFALSPDGKKSRPLQVAKDRLDDVVSRDFKAPINWVKHERFRLHWIERYTADELTAGFFLSGIVAPNSRGSASKRFKGAAEGYSFAFFLRLVLPSVFHLCEVTEQALASANLFQPGEAPARPAVDADNMRRLTSAVDSLATLPTVGFPGEHRAVLPSLAIQGQSLAVEGTLRLDDFRQGCRCTVETGAITLGEAIYLPYWASGAST